MKKIFLILLSLSLLLVFAACGEEAVGPDGQPVAEQPLVSLPEYALSLEELPAEYDAALAKEDGCVIFENGDVSSGQELWDSFLAHTKAEKAATIRLAEYDAEAAAPRLIRDLHFDGKAYTLRSLQEDGSVQEISYPYLSRYEGDEIAPGMPYEPFIRYALVEKKVSWSKLFEGFGQPGKEAAISFEIVYTDLL